MAKKQMPNDQDPEKPWLSDVPAGDPGFCQITPNGQAHDKGDGPEYAWPGPHGGGLMRGYGEIGPKGGNRTGE